MLEIRKRMIPRHIVGWWESVSYMGLREQCEDLGIPCIEIAMICIMLIAANMFTLPTIQ